MEAKARYELSDCENSPATEIANYEKKKMIRIGFRCSIEYLNLLPKFREYFSSRRQDEVRTT